MAFNPNGWTILKALDPGGQGWTYLVRRSGGSTTEQYVIKRLKNRNRIGRFENEIKALQRLTHPGIVRIVETQISEKAAYYVTEYCERGDLGKLDLSSKSLLQRLLLFREICSAVAAAHDANLVHRDLKPANILIRADTSVAVCDFGLCLDLSDLESRETGSSEPAGPWRYMAPELEDGLLLDPTLSCDCYSLGKLLYYILGGRSFNREKHREPGYDLRRSNSDPHLHFVYELFDKCIQAIRRALSKRQRAA